MPSLGTASACRAGDFKLRPEADAGGLKHGRRPVISANRRLTFSNNHFGPQILPAPTQSMVGQNFKLSTCDSYDCYPPRADLNLARGLFPHDGKTARMAKVAQTGGSGFLGRGICLVFGIWWNAATLSVAE